jgi:hypothetical protein
VKCGGNNNGVCRNADDLLSPPRDSVAPNAQFGGILGLAL